jgi:hypothetical protein
MSLCTTNTGKADAALLDDGVADTMASGNTSASLQPSSHPLQAVAKEYEERAHQIVVDGIRSEVRRSIGRPCPRDRAMQAASEGFPPKRAAQRALIQNW